MTPAEVAAILEAGENQPSPEALRDLARAVAEAEWEGGSSSGRP